MYYRDLFDRLDIHSSVRLSFQSFLVRAEHEGEERRENECVQGGRTRRGREKKKKKEVEREKRGEEE